MYWTKHRAPSSGDMSHPPFLPMMLGRSAKIDKGLPPADFSIFKILNSTEEPLDESFHCGYPIPL
jgi:hypothetical protein